MICPNCNSQVNDTYSYCPNCGAKIEKRVDPFEPTPPAPTPTTANPQKKDNPIAIIGFVFSFISPIIGLICSIIGYSNAKTGGDYRGLAVAGIAISAVYLVVSVIIGIIAAFSFLFFLPFIPFL